MNGYGATTLYDLVVELGYNDGPIVPGAGSAIFLHVARPDYGPTEGCVAIACVDLLRLLATVGADARLRVAAMAWVGLPARPPACSGRRATAGPARDRRAKS